MVLKHFCENCSKGTFSHFQIAKDGNLKIKSPAKRRGNAHQALSEAWVGGENAPDIYIIVTPAPNL